MMMMNSLIICRLLFFAVVLSCYLGSIFAVIASPHIDNDVNVPTFSLDDLLTGRRLDDLSAVLSTTGLLAVVLEDDYATGNVEDDVSALALKGLCRCASDNKESFLSMDGTDTTILDYDTTRTTLATATVGTTPLPLPDSLAAHCGLDTLKSMEMLRDQVAIVSDAFIYALDKVLHGEESSAEAHAHNRKPLLRNWDGGSYSSIASIRNGANHLEHFHVYNKKAPSSEEGKDDLVDDKEHEEEHESNTTLGWHTDAGLFLAFVPAINCNDKSNSQHQRDTSFWVMDDATTQTTTPIQAIFPIGSIAIMLGAGAEHWIDTHIPLKATKHAVKMQSGNARAWYGMSK